MTTSKAERSTTLDRQVAENVLTMLFRTHLQAQQLAAEVGMSTATMSRRMNGQTPVWALTEVVAIATYFDLTLEEMTAGLPSFSEWEARRKYTTTDSNREPADMEHGLPGGLLRLVHSTVNRELTAPGLPGVTLRAVS